MGAEVIPKDGRIRVEVTVKNPTTKQEHKKKLVADGGSPFTVINLQNAKDLGGTPGPAKGKHGGSDRFEISGLSMDIEAEDGSGKKTTKNCDKISAAEWNKAMKKGLDEIGCEGLLGMDQFDAVGADPAKNAEGTKAFMRLRSSEPKKEEK
jgi:hypothetical protein